jgi:hypothetical protein
MPGRLLRLNTLALTIGLFIAIWVFAIKFENGDSNAAIMYLLIGFLPVGLYVIANTLTLSYLVGMLERHKLDIIAFALIPIISFVLSTVVELLTPVAVFQYMTVCLAIINLTTFILFKTNIVKEQVD